MNTGNETRTNLIVNHLPHTLLETEFERIFVEIGPIKSYRIMRDLQTGSSFGFGFVEYVDSADAAKAIFKLNNYGIQNKRLKVSYAQPADGGDIKDTNLYIQNIPKTFTTEKLEELFSPFGKIIEKLVFKDKTTGQPKGIAFVKFQSRSEAQAAIEGLNGVIPEGGTEAIIVRVAREGTTKRNSSYQAGYQAGLAQGAIRLRIQLGSRGRGYSPDIDISQSYVSHSERNSAPASRGPLNRANNHYNPGTGWMYGHHSNMNIAFGGNIGF